MAALVSSITIIIHKFLHQNIVCDIMLTQKGQPYFCKLAKSNFSTQKGQPYLFFSVSLSQLYLSLSTLDCFFAIGFTNTFLFIHSNQIPTKIIQTHEHLYKLLKSRTHLVALKMEETNRKQNIEVNKTPESYPNTVN